MIAPSPTPADRRTDMYGHIAGVVIVACIGGLGIGALTSDVIAGLLWLPGAWVAEFWWLLLSVGTVVWAFRKAARA